MPAWQRSGPSFTPPISSKLRLAGCRALLAMARVPAAHTHTAAGATALQGSLMLLGFGGSLLLLGEYSGSFKPATSKRRQRCNVRLMEHAGILVRPAGSSLLLCGGSCSAAALGSCGALPHSRSAGRRGGRACTLHGQCTA